MEIRSTVTITRFVCLSLFIFSSAAWTYEIEGRIHLAPPWPEIRPIPVKKDMTTCGETQRSQTLVISENGFIQNAVVSLEGHTTLSSPNAFALALNARSTFSPQSRRNPSGRISPRFLADREELDVPLRKRVGDLSSRDSRRSDRTPYRPYGTARPSARPALVRAAVPDVRAADRRLTDWRLKPSGMTGRRILNQKDCHFAPHVLLVPQGQPFAIGNEDPMAHDVRAFQASQMLFRFEMDFGASPVEKKFDEAGRFVIRCGLHPWMHAYVISMEHPFYGISDSEGRFKLQGVPAGTYELNIWHEQLGEAKVPIVLSESITDFSYTFPVVSGEGIKNT